METVRRITRTYPSNPDILEDFYTWLEGTLKKFSADEKWHYRVTVASAEAFTNAIIHGNQSKPQKQVKVEAWLKGRLFWVKIGDEGKGSPPRAPKKSDLFDTSGRGWELMRQMADRLETRRENGIFWVELGFNMPNNKKGQYGKRKIGSGG